MLDFCHFYLILSLLQCYGIRGICFVLVVIFGCLFELVLIIIGHIAGRAFLYILSLFMLSEWIKHNCPHQVLFQEQN